MHNKLLIVSATRNHPKDTLISRTSDISDVDIKLITGNKDGLPLVYNRILNNPDITSKYSHILFAHDDILIEDARFEQKLFDSPYDITGIAGPKKMTVGNPSLWHLMCPRDQLAGAATHPYGPGEFVTVFGPTPARTVCIDGCFICVNVQNVLSKKWKFNENYTFHHYDIASCLDANKLGLKIGVIGIHVLHKSPGLLSMNDSIWSISNIKFLQEYGS